MTVISINNISFGYPGRNQPIFTSLTFNFDDTWKLGLVGRNGTGKTTLLHLLMTNYPHTGTINYSKDFTYFPASIKDKSGLTYYEIEKLYSFNQWEFEKECTLLDLNLAVLWRPFNTLSGGEKTKLLLAALFTEKNKFKLIDEPTNHLDLKSINDIKHYLQKKEGYIIVTHDAHLLNETVDHILAIEQHNVILHHGNYDSYRQQKLLNDQYAKEKNAQLKNEIDRLEKTVKEKKEWGNSREKEKRGRNIAARLMKRASAIDERKEKKIDEKKQLIIDVETKDKINLDIPNNKHELILQVEDFSLGFEKNTRLFEPINFSLFTHDKMLITGENGSGKSTFFHYILHQDHFFSSGLIKIKPMIKISTISQNTLDFKGGIKEFAKYHDLDLTVLLTFLKKMGFERKEFEYNIEDMSKGQKKKLAIVKSLLQKADLYLWDEPFNYLDIFSIEQLNDLILASNATMIISDHHNLNLQSSLSEYTLVKKIHD